MIRNHKILVLLLVFNIAIIASSKKHSLHRVNKHDVTAKLGSEVALYLEKPYVEWHKKPDILIGSVIDNEYHQIKKIGANRYRSLIIKKANLSDAGMESYFAIDDDEEKDYFNIHLYDENVMASLILNSEKQELTDESENNFEIDRESSENELIYQVEALPLDHLLVNGEVVEAMPCKGSERNSDELNCLEFNLTKALKLNKCTNKVDLSLSYGYENVEFFPEIALKTFNLSLDLKFPPKVLRSNQTFIYSEETDSEELSCEVECANPAENYEYKWTLGDETLFCSTETNKFTVNIKELEEKANSTYFQIVCTVSNEIDFNDDKLHESQTKFDIIKLGTVTTPMATSTTGKPITGQGFVANGSSEIGFFANLYNKAKFFISFNI